jgi:hypothetical protein
MRWYDGIGWLFVGITCVAFFHFIDHENWTYSIGLGVVVAFVSVIVTVGRRKSRHIR